MKGLTGRITKDRRFWVLLYVLTALLATVSVYEGIKNAVVWSQDFQYDAAVALMNGYDPYDMSLDFSDEALPEIQNLKGFYEYYDGLGTPQRMEANQFPSLLYILAPYGLLPYSAARILWVITNIAATACIIWLLKKTFMSSVDDRLYPAFILLMLMGTPWRNQIGVGQHTLFAFAFFLGAVYVSEKGEALKENDGKKALAFAVAAGLLLSACYIKYTVTAPLAVWFIYRKRFREFFISLIPHALLTGVAAFILHEPYTDMLTKPLKVASALAGEGSIDIGAITGGAGAGFIFTAAAMIFLVAVALLMPKENDELFISLAVLLSLVMTYHRTYDFFVMIIVFGYFATGRMKAAEVIYFITTLAFFFALRIFHENVISLTVAGALYYACVISFVVVSVEKCAAGRRSNG